MASVYRWSRSERQPAVARALAGEENLRLVETRDRRLVPLLGKNRSIRIRLSNHRLRPPRIRDHLPVRI